MRTFEFRDDKSAKFWNIELQGKRYTVSFGKVGKTGQTQAKEFADTDAARKAHDKLIKEKLSKGYVETTPKPAPSASLREALEAALFENPDDLAAHRAYADHLMESGDPRGEFIQVQLRLENPACQGAERDRLQKQEQELLRAHARQWLSGLAPFFLDREVTPQQSFERLFGDGATRWKFERGWLAFVRIEPLSAAFMQAFNANPLLRLLRHLVIPDRDWDAAGYEEEEDIDLLAESPHLGNVRQFQLGPDDDQCHMPGASAVDLVQQMPKLEELRLRAHRVDTDTLFALPLPRLRLLEVYHLYHYPLEVLAANSTLTNLEHLSFWPHMLEPGDEAAYITPEEARALVRSPNLPRLRVLELRNSDLGDEGCEEIVRSGLLGRLKVLNLTNGRVTDTGARTLAACPDLKNLDLLNVSGNMLTEVGLAALRATGVRVESAGQYGQDYLEDLVANWEGDME
jgi:uncharacterized protein (TIGR02996 family)